MRYRSILFLGLVLALISAMPVLAQTALQAPSAQAGIAVSNAAARSVDLSSLPQFVPQAFGGVKAAPPPGAGVPEAVYKARKAAVANMVSAGEVPAEMGAAPALPDDFFMMTPGSTKSIEGIDEPTCGGWIPSDHALAVGPTYVVQVLNECIRVTDN